MLLTLGLMNKKETFPRWVNVTDQKFWIPYSEDEIGTPGATFINGGWKPWLVDGYSEVWMYANYLNWPKYKATKMRITYSGVTDNNVTVYFTELTNYTNINVGEYGDVEPYSYSSLQEIDLTTLNEYFELDFYADGENFTIDKIELYIINESYDPVEPVEISVIGTEGLSWPTPGYASHNTYANGKEYELLLNLDSRYKIDSLNINGDIITEGIVKKDYGYYSYTFTLNGDTVVTPSISMLPYYNINVLFDGGNFATYNYESSVQEGNSTFVSGNSTNGYEVYKILRNDIDVTNESLISRTGSFSYYEYRFNITEDTVITIFVRKLEFIDITQYVNIVPGYLTTYASDEIILNDIYGLKVTYQDTINPQNIVFNIAPETLYGNQISVFSGSYESGTELFFNSQKTTMEFYNVNTMFLYPTINSANFIISKVEILGSFSIK